MKVSIQNLLGLKRSFSKPNGISVSINGYEQLHLVDQDKYEKFYLGYRNHDYKVSTQLEEVIEEVIEESVDQEESKEENNTLDDSNQEQRVIDEVEKQVENNVDGTPELTREVVVDSMNELSVEQLKTIASNLGIATSANKAGVLINKILNGAELTVVSEAIHSIKGDA